MSEIFEAAVLWVDAAADVPKGDCACAVVAQDGQHCKAHTKLYAAYRELVRLILIAHGREPKIVPREVWREYMAAAITRHFASYGPDDFCERPAEDLDWCAKIATEAVAAEVRNFATGRIGGPDNQV